MAKKYGGITGPKVEPTPQGAFGVWNSPTEVFREVTGDDWPRPLQTALPSLIGTYSFAISSGVVDNALASDNFAIASGGILSTTTYSGLFSIIRTTFGGNGTTNFAVPNLFDKFIYLKGTTTSGVTPITGSGVLVNTHNHTFVRRTGTGFTANTTGETRSAMTGSATLTSSFDGDDNNELRKRECIPLIATKDSNLPVGVVFPVLWPNVSTTFPSFDVSKLLVASGQTISRADYSSLFSLVGTLYGSGNGSTTFTIPDYRGIFISGPRQPASVRQPSGVLSPSGFLPDTFFRHAHTFPGTIGATITANGNGTSSFTTVVTAPASTLSTGNASESRSANISVIWCLATS
jgi:microcystin-dependent protein